MGNGNIMEATLVDGKKIQYVLKDNPPRGGMKHTYFTPDGTSVVQFYNNPSVGRDPNLRKRLAAILSKYNPTLPEANGGARGNSDVIANYFLSKYCWPTNIVESPEVGIVCPAYPSNFKFTENSSKLLPIKGQEKKSNWFTSGTRKYLEKNELGDFRSMLQIAISLARSVRRLHQAGLAHSDLSCNNVLIDPQNGKCVIIDIDSLVVPGIFPPDVAGTPNYIAPEVLETLVLPFNDPGRRLPCLYTDLHALAVLIYEYLLFRHPLVGPKLYSKASPEEDNFLGMGPKATFIEHPTDRSNRPKDLKTTIHDLGPALEKLFLQALADGLHHPDARPTAMEWEKGLVKTWDLLHPCENPNCEAKWFVLYDIQHPVCPFCGHKASKESILRLRLKSQLRGKTGQWVDAGEINAYNSMPLFKWHILANVFPDEKADRDMQAYICLHQGQWLLVNHAIQGMTSPSGSIVPIGQAVLLKDGVVFRTCSEERGIVIEVNCLK